MMRLLFSLPFLVSAVICQSIPNVFLTGEPKVISRRILTVDLKTAREMPLPEDGRLERYRVNVVDRETQIPEAYRTGEEQPVTVYRRILRPARITFTGDGVVSHDWKASSDAVELESWTLNKSPSVTGTIVQPAFHV